ncbi:alkaline phosphatase D family protein [Pilimelia columellifera]|uniref:Alkaline phosphatase D family protein n=1 Tax=Pilimelia columellifera subsp. columellifera TaxID=706583 RepID=A0ABN3N3U2_9ACTN
MPEAHLILGPLLRRVVGAQATVWVEVSQPVIVRVRAGAAYGEASSFSAFGRHYALVVVDGLTPGATTPYQVWLGDRQVWPQPDTSGPPSVIRTRGGTDEPVRLVFGSCREATQRTTGRGLGPDALDSYARRLSNSPEDWPDLLVLLGDQVYADETSPKVRGWLRERRRKGYAPDDQVMTYEEYTALYLESWRDPDIRWLLSTVPSVMIFDDHEIIDDWNSSASWRADIEQQQWWAERITNGIASYWVYQHLGNLTPDEIAADPVWSAVRAADDATAILSEFAARADRDTGSYRFSYYVDLAGTRLVMLDNRAGRVVEPGRRSMLPDQDWQWFAELAAGTPEHLVVGASLPWLLPPAVHHMENWNERLAESRRPVVRRLSERLRRALDLEHWAAFRASFDRLGSILRALGSRPAPPASISVLSGDVHHSYVARANLGPGVTAPVHQLTCSPLHNEAPRFLHPMLSIGWRRPLGTAARAVARTAGIPRPSVRWRRLAGPYFGNSIATLTHHGRQADVLIEGTTPDGALIAVAETPLTAPPTG